MNSTAFRVLSVRDDDDPDVDALPCPAYRCVLVVSDAVEPNLIVAVLLALFLTSLTDWFSFFSPYAGIVLASTRCISVFCRS